MKKVICSIILVTSAIASAQVSVSVKANMLYPTETASWKSISESAINAYDTKEEGKIGYNVGLSVKTNLLSNLYLMPEIYYTSLENKFTTPIGTTLKAISNRVDMPVLLGANLFGENFGIFVGPVASYNLSKDNQFGDFKENATSNFTVGYQLGAHVLLGKLIVNARYEGKFSNDERDFINNQLPTENVRYDNRASLFIVGVGYKF
ncbi:outer membrane beta-barrel protein [Capnocytophaga sp. ARDL2]|uniref:outer membrane beta-barrel protein n=1 Tax=Capnocytophaga sp. ARDL2 TaxID=3238809 RepID=UPI003557CAE7